MDGDGVFLQLGRAPGKVLGADVFEDAGERGRSGETVGVQYGSQFSQFVHSELLARKRRARFHGEILSSRTV